MQHAGHLGSTFEPARNRERRGFVLTHADLRGAQPPQHQKGVVAADADAELAHRLPQRQPVLFANDGRAHQQIGMAAPVFGERQQRDIDAPVEGACHHRRGPGVVDHRDHAARSRHPADRRHILDLEGIAARAFEVDDAGLRRDQCVDAGADVRIEILGDHAIALEQGGGKGARRPIDRVAHQHMVTGLAVGQQRHRDRGQTRGHDGRAAAVRCAFDFGQRIHECHGGGRARSGIGRAMHLARHGGRSFGFGQRQRLEEHA